jgi:hypothetical protein
MQLFINQKMIRRRKMKQLLTTLTIIVTLLGSASQALGFGLLDTGWPLGFPPRYHRELSAHSFTFPAGHPLRTALMTAVDRFNENPSAFWIDLKYDDFFVGLDNGDNETWIAVIEHPAVCHTISYWSSEKNGWVPVEKDIIFNPNVNWNTSMSKSDTWAYGGSTRPFQTTAIHELGHFAGLAHEAYEYNIMGDDRNHVSLNAGTMRSYVGEDASDGLVRLYGLPWWGDKIEDLSVVHWGHLGHSGEYSTHRRGKLKYRWYLGYRNYSYDYYGGMERFHVDRGDRVYTEFTYENNGSSTQTVLVGYYISTNHYITIHDQLIAVREFTLSRDDADRMLVEVTIPSNLDRGRTYYLGAIIDWAQRVDEITEANNAAYFTIKIK